MKKAVTVNDLYEQLKALRDLGKGNYEVVFNGDKRLERGIICVSNVFRYISLI